MNELKIFDNPEFGKLRTIMIDDEPWFVGKDVADALGYNNSRDALARHVDNEDKTSVVIPDVGSNYKSKTTFVNESGLYALVFGSKLTAAKKFKRWVFDEVLLNARKLSNIKGLEPYEPHNEALVEVKNNQIVTDSRSIAEHFGKEHKNVLRTIDDLVAQNSATKNMFLEQTREYRGRDFRYYLMNRDGFSLLVMGFTGKAALEWKLKYIEAFNKMEKEIANKNILALPDFTNPVEAARAWADEYEAKQKALAQVTELKPKAEYTDKVLDSDVLVNISTIAADYGMSGCELNRLLGELKVQYRFNNKGRWYLYKKYKDKGYVHTRTFIPEGQTKPVVYTAWTQKGSKFIHDLLKEHGKLTITEILSKNKD